MSTNTELVQALERLRKDTELVLSILNQNEYLDTTSQCVVNSLNDLTENLDDCIDQYDVA